jgi:DNA-binding MarR family transcriptional regulator
MASTDEIQQIIREVECAQLERVIKTLNETANGIGAVLRILYEQGGNTTSRRLCELLGVSSARVAALLKTMASKGLVTKEKDLLDARITVVSITPLGEETILKIKNEAYKLISRVIDRVGYERLKEFFSISKEIADVVEPQNTLFWATFPSVNS